MNDFVNAINALTERIIRFTLLISQEKKTCDKKNLHPTNMIIYFMRWLLDRISAYAQ